MVQAKLLAFMDDYQLNYGAIDMILTPDNELFFLEINAAGEYFWLDEFKAFKPGMAAQELAKLLMTNH